MIRAAVDESHAGPRRESTPYYDSLVVWHAAGSMKVDCAVLDVRVGGAVLAVCNGTELRPGEEILCMGYLPDKARFLSARGTVSGIEGTQSKGLTVIEFHELKITPDV